jgi:PAS domain S-box-containing protein
MKRPNPNSDATELRHRAETRLRKTRKKPRSATQARNSQADTQRLLHELQVHQIELEMQNTELQNARATMESLLEQYTDLYDFAPVGYFSLDAQGRILQTNLTGSRMLGVERARLIHRSLLRFVDPMSQPAFQDFLQQVFAGSAQQVCELLFQKEHGRAFWGNVQAALDVSARGQQQCRTVVSDITALKEANKARRRLDEMAVSNRELKKEIIRRQAVEKALHLSQQHQSQLLSKSRQLQDELRRLSRQLLRAQEEERKRISRELHDEITQILVGINVHLESLAREATVNPKNISKAITRTQRLVERSVEVVHQFARELRPSLLDDLGLITTVHAFMKDFTKSTGLRIQFTAFAGVEQLESTKRTVLYRVIQSALANVAQHAHASQVKVSIRRHGSQVCMEISDDGKAFNVDRVLHRKGNKGLGLLGMRERVEMVGGNFTVESAPDQGTTLRVRMPLHSDSRDQVSPSTADLDAALTS